MFVPDPKFTSMTNVLHVVIPCEAVLRNVAPDIYDTLVLVKPELEPMCWSSILSLFEYSEGGKKYARDFSIQAAGHVQMGNSKWRSPTNVCLKHVREKLDDLRRPDASASWSRDHWQSWR